MPTADSIKYKDMENRRTGRSTRFYLGQKVRSITGNLKKTPDTDTLTGGFYILNPNSSDGVRKYHHRFIPISQKYHFSEQHQCLPLAQASVDNLNNTMASRVARQNKSEAWQLPYLPKGYQLSKQDRSSKDNERGYRQLQPGDLIYFDIDQSGDVSRLSYSGIWRDLAKNSTFEAFTKLADDNIKPWGSSGRDNLTVAESLFGVVEELKDKNSTDSARNLAGRVRFTDALKDGSVQQDDVIILPKLAAPKPPSPSMYFQGDPVSKADFASNTSAKPKGRKFYLPHKTNRPDLDPSKQPQWQSQLELDNFKEYQQNCDLHMKARPLSQGQTFQFEVNFENLSDAELGLLICALTPSDQYIHRLGLGKPLGLGQVKVSINQVQFIDRKARYSQSSFSKDAKRYSFVWNSGHQPDTPLPLLMDVGGLVEKNTLAVVQMLGNPNSQQDNTPVTYPFATGMQRNSNQTAYSEEELYKWSTENYDVRNHKPQFMQDFNQEYQPQKPANATWFRDTERLPERLSDMCLKPLDSKAQDKRNNTGY